MKQHITKKDIEQLDKRQNEALHKWWKPKKGDRACYRNSDVWHLICYVDNEGTMYSGREDLILKEEHVLLLSIGQMIEFLAQDEKSISWMIRGNDKMASVRVAREGEKFEPIYADNLCDALWEAVKDKLNK